MASIRIRTNIAGGVLVVPGLERLDGKAVDVEVAERPDPAPPGDRWAAAAEAVAGLADYDFAAWADQRVADAGHGGEHPR